MADVVVKFGADADELTRALSDVDTNAQDAGKSLDTASASTDSWGSSAAAAANTAGALAAGVLAAGAAFLSLQQRVADARNDLNDMAARTGIASDTIAGLKLAAEGSGQSFAGLESALKNVAKDGLDIDQVVATIQAIEDPAERASKAVELLGTKGGLLVQALGDTKLDSFREFAREFGVDTGPEAAKAAGDWQRAVSELTTVFEGFIDQADLLEGTTTLLRSFTRGLIFVGAIGQEVFGGLSTIISTFLSDMSVQVSALVQLLSGDLAGALETMEEGISDPTAFTDAFARITGSVDLALGRVDTYNRLVAEMGEHGGHSGRDRRDDRGVRRRRKKQARLIRGQAG